MHTLKLLIFPIFFLLTLLTPLPILAQSTPITLHIFPANSDYFVNTDSGLNYTKYKNMTSDPRVWLEVTTTAPLSISQMRFSETGAWDTTPWQPYSAIKPWQFAVRDDQTPIYAQFRLANGQVITVSQMFIVDQSPPAMEFSLRDQSIGPKSQPDLVGAVIGQDTWSVAATDYRMADPSIITSEPWRELNTNQPTLPFDRWQNRRFLEKEDGEEITVAFQAKDRVGNMTQVMTDSLVLDVTGPLVYAKANPSQTLKSTIYLEAYDKHSDLANIFLSNDPTADEYLLYNQSTVRPFENQITWKFDTNRAVWIGVTDAVGNQSEPILVTLDQPSDTPPAVSPPAGLDPIFPPPATDPQYQAFQDRITQLEQQQQSTDSTFAEIKTTLQTQQTLIQKILTILQNLWPW